MNYEEYAKLTKKYIITEKTSNKTIKKKIIAFLYEAHRICDNTEDLFHCRIFDNFFENGERIAKTTKKAIKEEYQKDDIFKRIIDFNFNYTEKVMFGVV